MKAVRKDDTLPQVPATLKRIIAKVKPFMREPCRPVHVVVVDANESIAICMTKILLYWPSVFSTTIIQSNGKYPDEIIDRDVIVLLDERLERMTGTKVAEWLRDDGFAGILASTVCGESCPPIFKHHFQNKHLIGCSLVEAKKFVLWMNELILEIERSEKL